MDRKSDKQMKRLFIVFLCSFWCLFSFSQTGCGLKEMKAMVEKTTAASKQQDDLNDAKYKKAMDKLSKAKNWDASQQAYYSWKLINNKDVIACEENKKDYIQNFAIVYNQIDEKNETENNCKVIKEIEQTCYQVMEQNALEWKIILTMISSEYKTVTKKDLIIE